MAQGLPKPAVPIVHALDPPSDDPSRKERRRERKTLRAALKAVQLAPEAEDAPVAAPESEPKRSRRLHRRPRTEPAPELVEVTLGQLEPVSIVAPVETGPTGPPSYFPKPVYIPQAEYAQMLRDQKAAEKAAVEAAAELRRLAYLGPDEQGKKEEFSDWTSQHRD